MPSTANMDFSVGQATHPGLVREKNEDSFGWFSLPDGELFIVADGMGGYAGGAEASKRTVISFKEYFESHPGPPEKVLEEALLYADAKVQKIGRDTPALRSCGSTIVALFVSGSIGYFIHAGDSRLYVYNRGKLQQIGSDHSAVQEMLQAGIITREEAVKSPKNVITQSLGGNIDVSRCAVEQFAISPGSSVLLCSDGLWGPVPENRLEAIFAQNIPSAAKVNQMIKAAIDAGGPDNITAQVIEFGAVESQTQQIPKRMGRSVIFATMLVVLLLLLLATGYYVYKTIFAVLPPKPEISTIQKSKEQPMQKPSAEVSSTPVIDSKNQPQKMDVPRDAPQKAESPNSPEEDKE